jgi:endonuclease/exonuclease/phosphatase family metal-dependent hydrolase
MYYDGGEYGEGLLSKYSFISTRNMPLPFTPGNEPRAALEGVVELPSGDTIIIIGTHLDHLEDEKDRIAQAQQINTNWEKTKYPTILAGDLNALPQSKAIKILETLWTSFYDKYDPQPTYPSAGPTKKIDYVMHRPENAWRVLSTEVICDAIASDHCAYMVELELRK